MKQIIAATAIAGLMAATLAFAQDKDPTIAGIEKYREMLGDDNPAELYEMRGEDLWKKPAGPKNVSLEKCDLGLGPGVGSGPARLPAPARLLGRCTCALDGDDRS